MAGRRRTYTRPCSTAGCPEISQIEYTARRDLEGVSKTWTCRRHSKPNEHLTSSNLEQTTFLELHTLWRTEMYGQQLPLGNFWGPEGDSSKAHHGIVSGPGFWAEGKNFPPGTRLVVNARIELPTEEGDA